jgi:hypothetical protein
MTNFLNAAATSWLAAASIAAVTPARAQAVPDASSFESLERVFWACDHAATRGRIDVGTAIACVQATDLLKMHKFGGDFNQLLIWWRQHKDEQHLSMDRAAAAATAMASRR